MKRKNGQGTGDAVKAAKSELEGFDGNVLILYGDTPLITKETPINAEKMQNRTRAFPALPLATAELIMKIKTNGDKTARTAPAPKDEPQPFADTVIPALFADIFSAEFINVLPCCGLVSVFVNGNIVVVTDTPESDCHILASYVTMFFTTGGRAAPYCGRSSRDRQNRRTGQIILLAVFQSNLVYLRPLIHAAVPFPSLAPSMMPGISAMTKLW